MPRTLCLETPIGPLTLTASERAVTAIRFGQGAGITPVQAGAALQATTSPLLRQAACELEEYFAGTRREFSVPVEPDGTPFQRAVWRALQAIPYGQTRTYKQIAQAIGCPSACRAVGMANNRNPIPVIIPCHRVVGSDGKLVGYAGGLDAKTTLLELEK